MADLKLKKLEPVRVFEQAVEQIRGAILLGTFSAGEKLPAEQELSEQLNVGRSSIREALRVLEAEGLIEVRRGSGAYVTANPLQNTVRSEYVHWLAQREESLIQLLQVREGIEGLTASLLAVSATEEMLDKLREILSAQTDMLATFDISDEDRIDQLAQLDEDFHLEISKASGNNIAYEIISHIIPAYNESNKAVIYVGGRTQRMVKEHRQILEAIETRDPVLAEKAMRAHIARVRSEIQRSEMSSD
jgi:GntR family transcriptional repressor for pyruvate dehydrogenase complex